MVERGEMDGNFSTSSGAAVNRPRRRAPSSGPTRLHFSMESLESLQLFAPNNFSKALNRVSRAVQCLFADPVILIKDSDSEFAIKGLEYLWIINIMTIRSGAIGCTGC